MKSKELKLSIDLVPKTSWYKNLRKQMKQSQWNKLRKKVYAEQGNVCAICGEGGRLNCHEVWSYDEAKHIQKLIGFSAVCNMCHHVTHVGMAQTLASKGHLNLNAVVEHFMKVNGTNQKVFEKHKTEAFRIWRERSQHEWKTDLSEWASLVESDNPA